MKYRLRNRKQIKTEPDFSAAAVRVAAEGEIITAEPYEGEWLKTADGYISNRNLDPVKEAKVTTTRKDKEVEE